MKRRDVIIFLGATAAGWPIALRAQRTTLPVVGFINAATGDGLPYGEAFRKGMNGAGFVEGQNVTVEYHWLDNHYERLPDLVTDLVRRQVAVIAIPGSGTAALAAKAATSTIPIVFGVAEDPVALGLVDNLARPGSNTTGINFFFAEVTAKRLRLLHDLVPKAVRITVIVNPANRISAAALRAVGEAAPSLGLQVQTLNATTIGEIDAIFADFSREHPDAILLGPDAFFTSRREQFAALGARDRIPISYSNRDAVVAGGLMSYGPDIVDMFHQVGVYTGKILAGAKVADLPVVQSTKFVFALNLKTARALGIEVPSDVVTIADEVIE
jgi:putative tryptophan/tyrosine transport system substrate-binding protein